VKVTADSHRHLISILIQDNGKGITPDDLSKIFDPFFSSNPRKLGLGLSIANHIIRSHQGILEIDSEPGKGTKATISLPVRA
jgi:signal transduction histidine kinase